MKKSLLAMAVAAAISPAAFAQTNVTMYGIVDAGISADRAGTTAASGVSNGTAFRVNSGYMSTSRWGVTGTEDLGGGLKGVFTLELGFAADTGAFSATSTGAAGFNRRAFVGVQGGFGTIALGRDYTPFFWAQLATDTLGYGLYGNLLNSIDMVPGNSSNQFLRADNAIFYTSPNFGGLTVRGLISAGNENFTDTPGTATTSGSPKSAGRMYGIGGEYGAGPLTVAAAYQQTTLATPTIAANSGDRKDMTVGAKYNFGAFSVSAGWARIDPDNNLGTGINKNDQYWIGGSVGLGKGSLLAQFNQIRTDFSTVRDGRANTFALAYTYPFSRRTTAYVSYGMVNNNATSAVRLWASDNVVGASGAARTDADPRGLAIGVRHSF